MIPFFVVDRPINLEILKRYFSQHPNVTCGLMTNVHATLNFQAEFASFSLEDGLAATCGTDLKTRLSQGPVAAHDQRVIRIVDSGIFKTNQERGNYEELFDSYQRMHADFGIMIDFLRDKEKTLRSAEKALDVYNSGDYDFDLIPVTQGDGVDDYLTCYQNLKHLGSKHIAIGGLLKRRENTARYIQVRDETQMRAVIARIRAQFDPSWLFVLGAYNPSRHDFFVQERVWGSDFKGWMFRYTHKMELLQKMQEDLAKQERLTLKDSALKGLVTRRFNLYLKMKRREREYSLARTPSNKKSARQDAKGIKQKCLKLDKSTTARRLRYVSDDNLPKSYKEKVFETQRIIEQSEQDVRIIELHKYLDEKIMPNLLDN